MTSEKMKLGLLMGFIGAILVILALFVPVSTIFFALLIGLLFVLPILTLVLLFSTGITAISKKLEKPSSKLEKEIVVISN